MGSENKLTTSITSISREQTHGGMEHSKVRNFYEKGNPFNHTHPPTGFKHTNQKRDGRVRSKKPQGKGTFQSKKLQGKGMVSSKKLQGK